MSGVGVEHGQHMTVRPSMGGGTDASMWERWSERAWLGTVVPVYSMDVRRSTYVPRRIFRGRVRVLEMWHKSYVKTFERPEKKMRERNAVTRPGRPAH